MRYALLFLTVLLSGISEAQPLISYGRITDLIIGVDESFNGEVYAISSTTLYKNDLQNSGWTVVRSSSTHPGFSPTVIECDGLNLYVGTDSSGVYKRGPNGWSQFTTADGLSSNRINDLSVAASGRVWLATDSGVVDIMGSTVTVHTPFADNDISAIESVGAYVYAGNQSFSESVKKYDGSTWIPTPQSILSRNGTRSLEKGRNATLICESHAGVSVLENGAWNDIYMMGTSRAITEANNKVLFAERSAGNLYVWDGVKVDTLFTSLGLGFGIISELKEGFISGSSWIVAEGNASSTISLIDYSADTREYAMIGDSLIGAMRSNGALFDLARVNDPGPKGLRYANQRMGYMMGLWVASQDGSGSLRLSAGYSRNTGNDWYSGPVSNSVDLSFLRKYNQVWKISKADIEKHKILYAAPGYIAPKDIMTWPGNGDTANGEAWILAPFIDNNLNGIYEPSLGEVPDIRGKEALFAIANDVRGEHFSGGQGMGIEAHIMMYLPDTTNWDLGKTTLMVHVELKARRGNIFQAKVGMYSYLFTKPFSSEFGSDSDKQLVYHLGDRQEVLSVLSLGDSLTGTRFFFDSNLNLPALTRPGLPIHYWNALNAKFNDGTSISVKNPGDPNPWHDPFFGYNTSSVTTRFHIDRTENWYSMLFSSYLSGQLMIMEDRDILPSSSDCLDFALVYQNQAPHFAFSKFEMLDSSLAKTGEVNDYFDRTYNTCMGVGLDLEESVNQVCDLHIHPNPSQGRIAIELDFISSVEVYAMDGRPMGTFGVKEGAIDLSHLAAGIYIIRSTGERETYISKLVLE